MLISRLLPSQLSQHSESLVLDQILLSAQSSCVLDLHETLYTIKFLIKSSSRGLVIGFSPSPSHTCAPGGSNLPLVFAPENGNMLGGTMVTADTLPGIYLHIFRYILCGQTVLFPFCLCSNHTSGEPDRTLLRAWDASYLSVRQLGKLLLFFLIYYYLLDYIRLY